jgi:hypothetical protein
VGQRVRTEESFYNYMDLKCSDPVDSTWVQFGSISEIDSPIRYEY